MVADPRSLGDLSSEFIHDTQTGLLRCLGIYLDNTFAWKVLIDSLCFRLQQRLYFFRMLRLFVVDQRIMFIFYQAVLESLVRYGILVWFGKLTV